MEGLLLEVFDVVETVRKAPLGRHDGRCIVNHKSQFGVGAAGVHGRGHQCVDMVA